MAKKKQVEPSDWLDSKIKAIGESKMPEAQKTALLKEIGALSEDSEGKVSFIIFAKVKKIEDSIHKAMMAYTKIQSATIAEWEQIFKKF